MQQVEERRIAFAGHSYTDFTFHYILAGAVSPQTIGEIGEAIQSGLASFKVFITFFAKVLWIDFCHSQDQVSTNFDLVLGDLA